MSEPLDPMLPADESPNGREPMLPHAGIVSMFPPLPPVDELLGSIRDLILSGRYNPTPGKAPHSRRPHARAVGNASTNAGNSEFRFSG